MSKYSREEHYWLVLGLLFLVLVILGFVSGCSSEDAFSQASSFVVGELPEPLMTMNSLGEVSICESCVVPVFCPDPSCDDFLVHLIDSANESIDVMVFSFTLDSVRDALLRAHDRGVTVRVLMDKQQAGNKYSVDEDLENAGVLVARDTSSGYMHNKVVIIDKKIVVTGSFNFSKNARDRNDENYVIINDESIAQEYLNRFEKLWRRDYGTF